MCKNKFYSFKCVKLFYLYSEKSGFEPPGVKHNIQQISRLTYSNFSFLLANNINYRIEVNYGIEVKFIGDANYGIKVKYIMDVN